MKDPLSEFDDDFLKFELVKDKKYNRPDLHAFALMDELVPGNDDIVACSEHDEIWLAVDASKLFAKATKEQLRDLVRCGLRYDTYTDSLCMFV